MSNSIGDVKFWGEKEGNKIGPWIKAFAPRYQKVPFERYFEAVKCFEATHQIMKFNSQQEEMNSLRQHHQAINSALHQDIEEIKEGFQKGNRIRGSLNNRGLPKTSDSKNLQIGLSLEDKPKRNTISKVFLKALHFH